MLRTKIIPGHDNELLDSKAFSDIFQVNKLTVKGECTHENTEYKETRICVITLNDSISCDGSNIVVSVDSLPADCMIFLVVLVLKIFLVMRKSAIIAKRMLKMNLSK